MLRVLGGTLVAVTFALGSVSLNAQEIVSVDRSTDTSTLVGDTGFVRSASIVVPPGMSNLRELPAGTKTRRMAKGDAAIGGSISGVTETLIYSNTRGRVIIPYPPFFNVADDIATIAPDACGLTRFTFQVFGNENLSITEARPYTVNYALWDTCPEAFPVGASPSRLIAGTQGSVTITDFVQDVTEVEVDLTGLGVSAKTSMWLSITFTRDNCAVIGGAPALEGFSGDLISFPALGCSPNLGNFPNSPHASFNLEIYGDSTSCPTRHIQYRNTREDGGPINFGPNKVIVDDLTLITGDCLLTGYEVALRGSAAYDIELRNGCSGSPPADWAQGSISNNGIPGTYKFQIVGSSSTGTRIIRVPVNPPITVSGTIFLAVRANNSAGGPILTTIQAKIGSTEVEIELMDDFGGCDVAPLSPGSGQGAIQATLICDGPSTPGACCDMFIKECEGGADDGEPCSRDADCELPGLCNAPCREVPQINCPFPQRASLQLPAWVPGGVCDGESDPFADQINVPNKVCGVSACCFKDTDEIEKCRNLVERECDIEGDVSTPRQWQLGRLCGQNNQSCPLIACLEREGDCKVPHFTPGCNDSTCCSTVCRVDFDDFCCRVEWDSVCVDVAANQPACNDVPPNDSCEGAVTVPTFAVDTVIVGADNAEATFGDTDPPVCCHDGFPLECTGGGSNGDLCDDNLNPCPFGTCGPGAPIGRNTIWYEFVADTTSVSIDTCLSVSPARDSMLSVFRAGDPETEVTSCQTLGLVGCNDNGCAGEPGSFFDENSKLCVRDLVIGDRYYVMLSNKRTDLNFVNPEGKYDLRFRSPCPDERPLSNDFCDFAEPVTDTDCVGCDPVITDLTDATLQCPSPASIQGMDSDQWFEYTATCTGTVTMSTCGSTFDTSLLVYEGCDLCPNFETEPIASNDNADPLDAFPDCGPGSLQSMLTFEGVAGDCYRVRVGDQSGTGTTGDLNISCSGQCPSGAVSWIDPPLNTVDAGRPWLSSDANHTQVGIETIVVEVVSDGGQPGTSATLPACWSICENLALDSIPIEILSITALPSEQYEITLSRPLTQGAATTIEYLGNSGVQDFSRITTHPANSDGDFSATPGSDIFTSNELSNMVTRLKFLYPGEDDPFNIDSPMQGEPYSLDIDRSGMFIPLDLLDAVDLMNGAGEYPSQNLSTLPASPLCPN